MNDGVYIHASSFTIYFSFADCFCYRTRGFGNRDYISHNLLGKEKKENRQGIFNGFHYHAMYRDSNVSDTSGFVYYSL